MGKCKFEGCTVKRTYYGYLGTKPEYRPASDKKKCEEIKKRHKLVGDLIKHILNKRYELPKDGLVSAFYMYYDGWDGLDKEEWKVITTLEV